MLAQGAELKRFEAVEQHMGTLVRIRLYAQSSVLAQRGLDAAFARIRDLDEKLSDYKPDSELMKLCRSSGPTTVSPDLFRVIEQATQVSEATGGAFDITLGPVIALWRKAVADKRMPPEEARKEALTHCGYQRIKFDRKKHTVELPPGTLLDLGGIAKGFAAHEAIAVLKAHGLPRAMVAVSGDIAAGEPPPKRLGWNIEATGKVVTLRNATISTSGDQEQFVEIDGERYSHIVDPKTGLGLRNSREVSIQAREGAFADALATACSIIECSAKLLKHFNAE